MKKRKVPNYSPGLLVMANGEEDQNVGIEGIFGIAVTGGGNPFPGHSNTGRKG